jgi:trehalose 6-phosphate synthase
VSFGRDESGRTANRGAGGPVTALIGADVGPPRRRLGVRAATDEDPAVVGEHDHQVFGATLEPEPRLLDQAEPASQERQVSTVRLRLVEVDRQALRRCVHGDRQPAWSTSRTCVGC